MTGSGKGSNAAAVALVVAAVLTFIAFTALGTWQMQRRAWKHDLIARVDQRVRAPAVAAPGSEQWPRITASGDEYRHVRLAGSYLTERSALVQAVTELGSGYWVLVPLQTADGTTVLVNRGFVSAAERATATSGACEPAGEVVVTGLLRMTEPGGGFLRRNDPAADRWYSRDTAAIAAVRGLARNAPFFIDADAAAEPVATPGLNPTANAAAGCPIGGLTVIAFTDNHLVYAITWYTLALMTFGAFVQMLRWRRRRRTPAEVAEH